MAALAARLLAAGRDHVRACPARWSAASASVRSLATAGCNHVRAVQAEVCDRVAVGRHRSRVFSLRVQEEAAEVASLIKCGKQEARRSTNLFLFGQTAQPASVWRGPALTAWQGAKGARWRAEPAAFSVQMIMTQEFVGSIASLGRELPVIMFVVTPLVYPFVSSAVARLVEAANREDPAKVDAKVVGLLMDHWM